MLPQRECDEILENLSGMTSYAKRIAWAKENLEYIGSGSSRSVFVLDDDSVIKIAKNPFGLAQNQVEGDYGLAHMYGDILAKVLYADDENYFFIISERAHATAKSNAGLSKSFIGLGIDPDEFREITQRLGNEIRKVSQYQENRPRFDELATKYSENEVVHELIDMCINFNILPGDFTRFSSWGTVKRKDGSMKFCLKDYGLNLENHKEFILDPMTNKRNKYTAMRGW